MNSTTLITGSSQGIGAATAVALAQRGHRLFIHCHRQREAAEAVAHACRQAGSPQVVVGQGDVGSEADVLRLFAQADAELPPLTGLVNNAGIVDHTASLVDMSGERLQRMLAVNVLGTMWCAREAVRRMARSRGGAGGVIVNVSSSAVRSGSPGLYVDYAASKGAVDVFTQGLSKEVAGDGVRVVAVRPGITDTGIHAAGGEPDRAARLAPQLPMGRAAAPAEVAAAIAWLLSEEAVYTAGAILDVTGGR